MEVMLAFMKLGYNVLIPYGDCERYDFVVEAGKKFYKIQSKTSSTDDEGASFKISCRSCNRKEGKIIHHLYSKEEIDYFATCYNNKTYLIPVEECGSDKRLRLKAPKNNQIRGVNWAEDYCIEEVVKKW